MSAATDSNPPGELYCATCEKTYQLGERCPLDGTRLVRIGARVDPFLGRDLDGRYTVIERLGAGGMGAVYRAEQHSVSREVAIKVINSSLVSEPEVIKRFLREAKLASKLSHPNAVGVLDFGQTEDGVFYLVMELVAGRTLDEVIKAERRLRAERVVRIGTQICDALEGAHALKIIHRDLKPANIMLLSSGRDLVKVLDFGLAKSTSPDLTSTTMTGTGAVVGTPAFMPPELATGEPCDARADLYSLGVILYLLGSGQLPFVSDSAHELIAMHGSDEPAPPMTGVPPRLANVIDKLIAKRPADRYQTAVEARTALEDSLVGKTPGPAPVDQTNPSLGPFPVTRSQLGPLETPVPASLVAATQRRKPNTAMERIMTGETMLAAEGIAPATSQPGREGPRKKRWPLFAGAGVVIAGSIVAITLAARGDEEPAAAKPAAPTAPAPANAPAAPPAAEGTAAPKPSVTPIEPAPETAVAPVAETPPAPAVVTKPATSTRPVKTGKPSKTVKPPPPAQGSAASRTEVKTEPPKPPPPTGTGSAGGDQTPF